MSHVIASMDADSALEKLKEGNRRYVASDRSEGDVSRAIRLKTAGYGQQPYAVVITCSDSRVIPEAIFSAGIGQLFVIRVAGNVIDNHQLGSIEYAADHLGVSLILVLGHTGCGAVSAAMHHDPEGYIRFITDEIKAAIGEEQDEKEACRKNVMRSVQTIESSLEIRYDEEHYGLKVVPAIYDIASGQVEFLN